MERTPSDAGLVIAHAAWPQLLLQGQSFSEAVDQCRRHHRLPGLRRNHRPVRGAAWLRGGSRRAPGRRLPPCEPGVDRYKRRRSLSLERRPCARRSGKPTSRPRSTTSGAPCPTQETEMQEEERRFPEEPEENLLYFVERTPLSWNLWREVGAHRAQDRPVLPSPTPDPGDGRGAGHPALAYTLLSTHSTTRASWPVASPVEFLQSHTSIDSAPYSSPWCSRINPYALGFAMWRDVTGSDGTRRQGREWFPGHRRLQRRASVNRTSFVALEPG